MPFFHPKSRSPSASDLVRTALVRQDFRTLAGCLALAQLQQRPDCLICTWAGPGGADGGRRAPWEPRQMGPYSAPRRSHPRWPWGERHCEVCLSLSGSWLIVSLLCLRRRAENAESACVSLTSRIIASAVKTNRPLIVAIPDHQPRSDKVAISSQQSGAITCWR